jgi:hypothetical protein
MEVHVAISITLFIQTRRIDKSCLWHSLTFSDILWHHFSRAYLSSYQQGSFGDGFASHASFNRCLHGPNNAPTARGVQHLWEVTECLESYNLKCLPSNGDLCTYTFELSPCWFNLNLHLHELHPTQKTTSCTYRALNILPEVGTPSSPTWWNKCSDCQQIGRVPGTECRQKTTRATLMAVASLILVARLKVYRVYRVYECQVSYF